MQLCSRSELCKYDITEKLKKWQVASSEFQKILNYLENEQFFDDRRYAEAFVKDKFRFNRWGKQKITFQLKQKRIAADIIHTALEQIPVQEYLQLIADEAEKKIKTISAPNEFELKNKTARYLISKGFETNLVFKVLNHEVFE